MKTIFIGWVTVLGILPSPSNFTKYDTIDKHGLSVKYYCECKLDSGERIFMGYWVEVPDSILKK